MIVWAVKNNQGRYYNGLDDCFDGLRHASFFEEEVAIAMSNRLVTFGWDCKPVKVRIEEVEECK